MHVGYKFVTTIINIGFFSPSFGKISALATTLDAEQTPINKEIELFVKVKTEE